MAASPDRGAGSWDGPQSVVPLGKTGDGVTSRLVVVAAISLVLAGCTTREKSLPYNPALLGVPDRPSIADVAYDVPLGPLDLLHVTVLRVTELSGDFQVDAHGEVDLPLIGAISVRDQSPESFARKLRQLYGERYLNNPDITVRVVTTNGTNITIEGGVNQSGIYPLPGRTTLLGAVALAHGVNEDNGNPRRVAIFRKQGGKTVAAAFDLISIHHGKMVDPVVYPGDTIVVDDDLVRKTYRDLFQSLPALALFHNL